MQWTKKNPRNGLLMIGFIFWILVSKLHWRMPQSPYTMHRAFLLEQKVQVLESGPSGPQHHRELLFPSVVAPKVAVDQNQGDC